MIRFDLAQDWPTGGTLVSSLDKASHLASRGFYPIQYNIDTSKTLYPGLELNLNH